MTFLPKLLSDRSFLIAPLLVLITLGVLFGTGSASSAAIAVPAVIAAAIVGAGLGAVGTSGDGAGKATLENWHRWGLFALLVAGVATGVAVPLANLRSSRPADTPVVTRSPKEDKQQQALDASFSSIAATIPPYGDDLNQHLSKLQGLMKDLPTWFEALDKSLKGADDVLGKAKSRGNQPMLVAAMTKNLGIVRERWPQATRNGWTERATANSKSIEAINKSPLMTYTRDKIAKLNRDELLALITTLIPEMNKHDYRGWAKAEVQAFEALKKKIDDDVQFLSEETSRGKAQLEQPGDLPEPAKWPEPPKGSAPTPPSSDPGTYQDKGEDEPEHKRDTLADVARFLGFGKTYRVDLKRGSAQQGDVTAGQAPSTDDLKQKARSFDTDEKFLDWLHAMQLWGARADWPEDQRKRFRDDLAAEAKKRLSESKWATSPELADIRAGIEAAWKKGERESLAKPDSSNLYKGKFDTPRRTPPHSHATRRVRCPVGCGLPRRGSARGDLSSPLPAARLQM